MTTALVTGASSGIGLELARLLRYEGHDIVLVARSEERLRALADELGPSTRVIAADLREPGTVARIVDEVPSVDVLINNAGVGSFGPFVEGDREKALAMIQLNVAALTELTHAYLPAMVKRRSGKVLNVASTAAFQPGPLMAVYYATKAYVLSFTEAIAEEVRGTGVKVTVLCPGPTESGFQAEAAMEESRLVKGRKLPSSREVAEAGFDALRAGTVVAIVGGRNKALATAVRFAPRGLMRRIVHQAQKAK